MGGLFLRLEMVSNEECSRVQSEVWIILSNWDLNLKRHMAIECYNSCFSLLLAPQLKFSSPQLYRAEIEKAQRLVAITVAT